VVSGDLSQYTDAERALRRAIRLLEDEPPQDHTVIQLFHLRLAEVYLDAGRFQEAAALFDELRRNWEQTRPESAELAVVLDDLAWIEVIRRNQPAAEALLLRAIRILESQAQIGPWRMGEVLNDYGSMLFTMKRYADAAKYAERANALYNREKGAAANATTINTWVLLGATYAYTGRSKEAEAYVRQSISAARALYGDDSLRAGRIMAVCAAVLQHCGQKAEAKSIRKQAEQILAKAGREDPGRFTIDVQALR